MTIASTAFLGFAAAVALLYNLLRPVWWRQGVLLLANGLFLGSFMPAPAMAVPLLAFVAVTYACVRLIQRGAVRAAYPVLLAGVVLLFFWLKRYSFLPQASFLPFAYSVTGLSYIFFRALHVMIDAHDGTLRERGGPVAYVNYLLNFTSLVSGPIQRFQDYARTQLGPVRPPLGWVAAGQAVERIATGLFKVVVLATVLNGLHGRALAAFAAADSLGGHAGAAVAATVAYTVYLYCNFSGYTDIVIGAARFHRLDLPENFDRPFSATTFIDFWARWHMTLSEWLRTYVYNPLVKALVARFPSPRTGPALGVFAFFVTFFLIGLWHGQTSVYAVYGLLLGFGVSVNKLWQIVLARRLGRKPYRALTERPPYRALSRGLTFAYFNASLVFFWADWAQIGAFARGLGVAGVVLAFAASVLAGSVVLAAGVAARDACLAWRWAGTPVLLSRYVRTVQVTALGAVALAVLLLMAAPAPDVVYRTF